MRRAVSSVISGSNEETGTTDDSGDVGPAGDSGGIVASGMLRTDRPANRPQSRAVDQDSRHQTRGPAKGHFRLRGDGPRTGRRRPGGEAVRDSGPATSDREGL